MPLACIALACSSGKVLLRYHPKANTTHRYALDEQMKMTVAGTPAQVPAMNMGMSVQLRERVGEPSQGGTAVSWSIDTLTLSAPAGVDVAGAALAAEIARIRAMSFDLVYDDRRIPLHVRVSDPLGEAPPEAQRVAGNVQMFNYPLPVEPVGKGDHWRVETDIPLAGLPDAGGPISVQSVLTVKDITVTAGDTTVVFVITTQFPDRPITMSRMGQTMTMKVSGTINGEQSFSMSQGMVLDGNVNGTIQMTMTIPGLASAPITMALDMQATLKRLGAP